jgi:hypothetical protein
MSNYKYTPEIEDRMRAVVANGVTEENIESLVKELNFPRRSVAAKLRSMGLEVPSKAEAPKFSADETKAFSDYLTANSGQQTAEEISKNFAGGKFTSRQVMGKALALELTSHVKKTEKKEKPKTYTADEEAKIHTLVGQNAFLEDIAAALNKPVNSVRGKLLSMDLKAPQKNKKAPVEGGSYPELEKLAPTMTVAELVAHYAGKTERGIKTALSRRGVAAKDYPGKKAAA